jgi:DNA-binding LacI/PurR family transcriptional regulator
MLVEGIEKAAQQHGFNVLLGNSDYSIEKEQTYIQLLVKHNVDGILLSPVETHTSLPLEVRKYKIPVVQVDRQSTLLQCDLVKTDSFQGAYDAVRSLIRQGYRRIAIICGPKSHSTGKERLAGYSAVLREAGIRVPQDYVQITEFREEHGYESALQLLQTQPTPDAIFVGNVDLTIGVLRALHKLKVHIPDDIGIIGFDDFEFAPILAPPLTTVEQPIRMLALSAVDLLVRRIVNSAPAEPVTIKLVPRLIVRESTRVQPHAEPTLDLEEPLAGFLAEAAQA